MFHLFILFFNFFLCSQEDIKQKEFLSFLDEPGQKDKKKLHILIHGTEAIQLSDKWLSLKAKLFGLSKLKKIKKSQYESCLGEYEGEYWSYILQQENFGKELYKNLYDYRWGYKQEKTREFINGPWSSVARKEAGEALYLLIVDYCSENNIAMRELELCVFGFSHGGNVAAEFLNKVREERNNELKIKQLFFFETPKTKLTEKAIHQKNAHGEYIVENIIDINSLYPKDKIQILDFTASFPYCNRCFSYSRKNLFEFCLTDSKGYSHTDILDYYFLKSIKFFFDNSLGLKNNRGKGISFFCFGSEKEVKVKKLSYSFKEKINL